MGIGHFLQWPIPFFSMKPNHSIYWNIVKHDILPDNQSWLSAVEQTRYQQFRFQKKSRDWLSGRWAVKSLLRAVFSKDQLIPFSEFSVQNEDSGAPFVEWNGKRLLGSLSISHRGGLAAAAYYHDPEMTIGIDLELIEAKSRGFVEDYFTAQEASQVLSLPDHQQALAASLLWSGREALLKALQMGLRIDTRQIALEIPNFSVSDDWQPLEIRICPSEGSHLQLFWKKLGQALLTLAIRKKHPKQNFNSALIQQIN